jgi:hypothetical protein
VSLRIPSSSRSLDHDPHRTIYYLGYPLGRFAGLKHRQLARRVGEDHHHRRTRRTSSSKSIYQDQSIRRRAVPIGGHHTSRQHASPRLDISVCQISAHGRFNFVSQPQAEVANQLAESAVFGASINRRKKINFRVTVQRSLLQVQSGIEAATLYTSRPRRNPTASFFSISESKTAAFSARAGHASIKRLPN